MAIQILMTWLVKQVSISWCRILLDVSVTNIAHFCAEIFFRLQCEDYGSRLRRELDQSRAVPLLLVDQSISAQASAL